MRRGSQLIILLLLSLISNGQIPLTSTIGASSVIISDQDINQSLVLFDYNSTIWQETKNEADKIENIHLEMRLSFNTESQTRVAFLMLRDINQSAEEILQPSGEPERFIYLGNLDPIEAELVLSFEIPGYLFSLARLEQNFTVSVIILHEYHDASYDISYSDPIAEYYSYTQFVTSPVEVDRQSVNINYFDRNETQVFINCSCINAMRVDYAIKINSELPSLYVWSSLTFVNNDTLESVRANIAHTGKVHYDLLPGQKINVSEVFSLSTPMNGTYYAFIDFRQDNLNTNLAASYRYNLPGYYNGSQFDPYIIELNLRSEPETKLNPDNSVDWLKYSYTINSDIPVDFSSYAVSIDKRDILSQSNWRAPITDISIPLFHPMVNNSVSMISIGAFLEYTYLGLTFSHLHESNITLNLTNLPLPGALLSNRQLNYNTGNYWPADTFHYLNVTTIMEFGHTPSELIEFSYGYGYYLKIGYIEYSYDYSGLSSNELKSISETYQFFGEELYFFVVQFPDIDFTNAYLGVSSSIQLSFEGGKDIYLIFTNTSTHQLENFDASFSASDVILTTLTETGSLETSDITDHTTFDQSDDTGETLIRVGEISIFPVYYLMISFFTVLILQKWKEKRF